MRTWNSVSPVMYIYTNPEHDLNTHTHCNDDEAKRGFSRESRAGNRTREEIESLSSFTHTSHSSHFVPATVYTMYLPACTFIHLLFVLSTASLGANYYNYFLSEWVSLSRCAFVCLCLPCLSPFVHYSRCTCILLLFIPLCDSLLDKNPLRVSSSAKLL